MNRQNTLDNEVAAERKKRHEAWLKREEERQLKLLDTHRQQLAAADELVKVTQKGAAIDRAETEFTLDFKKKKTEDNTEIIEELNKKVRAENTKADLEAFALVASNQLEGAFELAGALEELGIDGGKLTKALAVTQTIINVARAVVAALSTQPFFPLGLIAAGTATAIGVAQLSKIKNQKTVSKARGGMVFGSSHQMGGVQFGRGGIPHLELEGGEAVINKHNTARFRPLLSAINSHGNKGGRFAYGGIIPKFQAGGVLENQINNLGPTIENAIEDAAPVLVLEDINEAAARVQAVEDIASAS